MFPAPGPNAFSHSLIPPQKRLFHDFQTIFYHEFSIHHVYYVSTNLLDQETLLYPFSKHRDCMYSSRSPPTSPVSRGPQTRPEYRRSRTRRSSARCDQLQSSRSSKAVSAWAVSDGLGTSEEVEGLGFSS